MLRLLFASTLLALPGMSAASAPAAPHVRIASVEQLPRPLPLPYDTGADADAQVAAAQKRARATGRRLLIDLGGNWCLDCRILAGIMDLPELKGFVARHFEVVTVDIGRFDKNGQIAARYGIKDRLEGVPAILIVDPRTGRLVNTGRVTALADARSMTPQALADWLAQWA
nr:thioredoxin family protein [Sphingomonas gellani]